MAWHCTGRTNSELITNLFCEELITSARVRDAMIKVDRAHYTPSDTNPYEDSPQAIGYGATISAPHMHAHAVEALLEFVGPGKRVLDIGSGSGYLVHVFAELVFPMQKQNDVNTEDVDVDRERGGDVEREGLVVGIEHINALRVLGEGNMGKSERGKALLEGGRVRFVRGDGREGLVFDDDGDGGRSGKGWDCIHVGAAAVEIHECLVEQLARPGRIFIPVADHRGDQHIWVVDKDTEGRVERRKLFGVRYVPLTDAPEEG